MERMTPEAANAEVQRIIDRAAKRWDHLESLSRLRREHDYWPTRANPLDLDNEVERAHADIADAAMRVDSLTEEVRLGLIERGD